MAEEGVSKSQEGTKLLFYVDESNRWGGITPISKL